MFRRRSRADRWAAEVEQVSPIARAALTVAAGATLIGLAYLARRNLWRALAIFADAVEEVADTVEDAAEDVRDTARARAE